MSAGLDERLLELAERFEVERDTGLVKVNELLMRELERESEPVTARVRRHPDGTSELVLRSCP